LLFAVARFVILVGVIVDAFVVVVGFVVASVVFVCRCCCVCCRCRRCFDVHSMSLPSLFCVHGVCVFVCCCVITITVVIVAVVYVDRRVVVGDVAGIFVVAVVGVTRVAGSIVAVNMTNTVAARLL